jgi:hypothetical protein
MTYCRETSDTKNAVRERVKPIAEQLGEMINIPVSTAKQQHELIYVPVSRAEQQGEQINIPVLTAKQQHELI